MQPGGESSAQCKHGVPCRALVRFETDTGVKGTGRIRVIGSRGACIETRSKLPAGTPLSLLVLGNESAVHVVEIAATVVTVTPDGVEVEWREPASCPICSVVGCGIPC